MSDTTDLIAGLEEVLDLERHAIRHARLGDVAEIVRRKEELVAAIGPAQAAEVQRLRPRFEENQRLLGAALRGLRAAQRRLEMIRNAGKGIESYDSRGRARKIGADAASLERRA